MATAAKGKGVKNMLRVAIAVALAGLLLTGCGEVVKPEKVENTPAATPIQKLIEPPKSFAIGETVKMKDLQLTVNSARSDAGGKFLKPKEGHVYLLVNATLENVSGQPQPVSSMMFFKLTDADGYNYSVTIGPDTRGQLDGEIGPGRKMRGELAFEVPQAAKDLELIFGPNILGLGQALIKLGDTPKPSE